MKVTLRQAHKLVEKIAARLATLKLTTQASVSIHDDREPELVMSLAFTNYEKEVNRQLSLLGARQEIRTSVQAVNGVEINGLVAIRKNLLDQLATYRHLQGTVSDGITSAAELASKIAAEKASTTRYGSDFVAFGVLNPAQVEALDKKINELQLRVEAIEDQLSVSNASVGINLSETTVRVLRSEGIVQ